MADRFPDLLASPDPFVDAAAGHGAAFKPFDSAARDFCRKQAKDCACCADLVAAFDEEMSRAFINGTGPFA